MAGSVFATAGTPSGQFSDLPRTNSMRFSEGFPIFSDAGARVVMDLAAAEKARGGP
jgi:hypothetical protein